MSIFFGPVLNLRATQPDQWNISILIGSEQPNIGGPILSDPKATDTETTTLTVFGNKNIYRIDLEVPLADQAKEIEYRIGSKKWTFTVPAKQQRCEMVFVSCNGFSSGKEAKKVDDKFALWKRLTSRHDAKAYNLMIMGGDQIYADEIWTKCREIEKWTEKPVGSRRKAQFSKNMAKQVEKFYFDLYCSRWTQEPLRRALASIPTTMMWDDHDIFDGWGSYEKEDQECPVYQGIFAIAKKYFRVFQQQLKDDESETHPSSVGQSGFSNLHQLHKTAVLTLDARNERSQTQVIGSDSWKDIFHALDHLDKNAFEHIFIVAPVPVVHADFGLMENIGGWALSKAHLEDDLRDHWQNGEHRVERLRLIHRLFSLMEDKQTRVTILSGDVHVACQGQIDKTKSNGEILTIDQLTASGIIHPASAGLMGWVLERLSRKPEPVDQGIEAKMNDFSALRKKYILKRNYLSLEPDDTGRFRENSFFGLQR